MIRVPEGVDFFLVFMMEFADLFKKGPLLFDRLSI